MFHYQKIFHYLTEPLTTSCTWSGLNCVKYNFGVSFTAAVTSRLCFQPLGRFWDGTDAEGEALLHSLWCWAGTEASPGNHSLGGTLCGTCSESGSGTEFVDHLQLWKAQLYSRYPDRRQPELIVWRMLRGNNILLLFCVQATLLVFPAPLFFFWFLSDVYVGAVRTILIQWSSNLIGVWHILDLIQW